MMFGSSAEFIEICGVSRPALAIVKFRESHRTIGAAPVDRSCGPALRFS